MKILINNQEQENIKAIQVDDYFVIVDTKAEIKNNDYYHIPVIKGNSISKYNEEKHFNEQPCISLANLKATKIIASTERIDSTIPLIAFRELSLDNLAKESTNNQKFANGLHEKLVAEIYYKRSYSKAKSSDKKYTEQDILNVIQFTKNLSYINGSKPQYLFSNNDVLSQFQSLNQPKLPDVINLRTEWTVSHTDSSLNLDYKLKTTSTPDGEIVEITI